ncbi:hypothetical protein B0T26DRAFT_671479 [Lasiosphaeria miniovina]|uniref:Protein kinase domain-containing protein n=1 Tax=Lasiosphaeria miniovina TaxID=1954250 RepID=A0AA40E7C3_9PEZI|nr:uncharacterized protein B0T26DRAFT_671479 [Lasiosphaeria miniovina]KAK0726711.1 hypothetical protein B0T26DRAFT_671479 [Lasiosphaeria miniovina]
MTSFIPMAGVQLPFQRRLSRLYNDTKKSSDFVKEPAQNAEADPEIKALHRKLRIQKDRLVTWGLEWSDPSQSAENQSAEVLIDSSLSKAGLSEIVGSIMSTIKDILAEAEPLWHSSRRLAGERFDSDPLPRRGEKIRLVVWDRNRFEDLVRDLTTSIDTLYDLSRTRSSYAQASAPVRARLSKPSVAPEDERPFESSRIQAPTQIDPKTLRNLRSMQAEPMTDLVDDRAREIVFMSQQAYSELIHGSTGRESHAPLLLEYASFDSIYSITGITPPLTRFEKLSSGLQSEPQRSPGSWTGLPRLVAYFEDMENSRYGLVYQFPRTFNPVSFEHLTRNPLYNLCSLSDLLARPDFEPKLEAKFRLAANLANTIFDLHARGITHGNLIDKNVSFCNAVGTDPEISGITQGEVDIRRPLVSSFDLFSDPQSEDAPRPFSLYMHPLDPRNSVQSPLLNHAGSKTFDLYSLAMVLLSVGLWTKLENLVPNAESGGVPESLLGQLAIRCGTLYTKAVQACWNAVDLEMKGSHTADQIVSHVQFKASRYLEACCILDGVSNLEERLGDDIGDASLEPESLSTSQLAGTSKELQSEKQRGSTPATPSEGRTGRWTHPSESPTISLSASQGRASASGIAETPAKLPSAKTRLYPQVPLPPHVIQQWSTIVMPQINIALHHFYRKNPESVEISLESIGESPQSTKPTVLVVCTSVGKVRAILKKRLATFFDGTTGLALKVCRGQVLRSRNDRVGRSMTRPGDDGHDEIKAANPDYQERPSNGASIGAWIGDRHLPPVSFGGLIVVDDKPYGMTVHHMLDDPDQGTHATTSKEGISRSMAGPQPLTDLAAWYAEQYPNSESDPDSSGTEDYACEFSESDSDSFSESAITSDDDEEDDDDVQYGEVGDIPGIEPGCGEGYIVTQPAQDDVPDGFYPSSETQDEDHLDTYGLGEVYASSGIKRRLEDGMLHEIDWALFEFKDDRLPDDNLIPRADQLSETRGQRVEPRSSRSLRSSTSRPTIHPTTVARTSSLPGLEVQCMARTSGLQTGLILPAVASVKIYGRMTPSHIYQVSGTSPNGVSNRTTGSGEESGKPRRALPMGIPGDSGAWVVDRHHGQLCGHVLAWSERKRVAYVCPMDVLLLDIAETLEAGEIRLPSGEVLLSNPEHNNGKRASRLTHISEASDRHCSWYSEDVDTETLSLAAVSKSRWSRTLSQNQRGSLFLSQQQLDSLAENDNDEAEDDSYDEGVEVELARDIKKMHLDDLAERDASVQVGRWRVT